MCGIAGVWRSPSNFSHLPSMIQKLHHRGPDASGWYANRDELNFAHRRLSIMDPAGGDQPIYTEGRDMAIVANGEVYNHPELRFDLKSRHHFQTTSDTETTLHLFEDKGVETAATLDGMFALAIADDSDLYLARDALGIKPLYYTEEDRGLCFASELKALAPCSGRIREFPPGTYFHSQEGFVPFYTIPDLPTEAMSVATAAKEVRQTLIEAVQKRLMSDVPLGAFLSGGLDSSLIAAIARQTFGQPLHTFSVGLEGSPDLEAARWLSNSLDTIHHEHILSISEVLTCLPQIIYHLESFDQDLVRSAIPTFFTARLAAEEVKVILTGEGADELFAGYTYYKDIPNRDAVLHQELRRSVANLHHINLQRVDRLTMAHCLEGRVPFLDLKLVELAQRIPSQLKLRGQPLMEKWILRYAFEDMLPKEILWRRKAQFDEGSGTVDLLKQALSSAMSEADARQHAASYPEANLRSAEECYYHKLFMDVFDNAEKLAHTVGRWAERPEWGDAMH